MSLVFGPPDNPIEGHVPRRPRSARGRRPAESLAPTVPMDASLARTVAVDSDDDETGVVTQVTRQPSEVLARVHRCRRLRFFPRFMPLPLRRGPAEWAWDGVYEKEVAPGNVGLFASRDLAPGLLIPYLGRLRPEVDDERADEYAYSSQLDGDKAVVDAKGCDACIARRVNEATKGKSKGPGSERYNCRSYLLNAEELACFAQVAAGLHGGEPEVPHYEAIDPPRTSSWAECRLLYMVMCPIPKDAQLFVYYSVSKYINGGADTYKRVGYEPQSATVTGPQWNNSQWGMDAALGKPIPRRR